MPDDKTKKKIDRKFVSLKQKHERDYLKKIANKIQKKLKKFKGTSEIVVSVEARRGYADIYLLSKVSSIRRICEALLKFLK